jgi:ABC-type nitrate/sulfonate/bicarbonate transport system permease component
MADARLLPHLQPLAEQGRVGAARVLTPALRQRIESLAFGTATIVLLLVVWELLPHVLRIQQGTRLFFTVPSRIFATLWQMFAAGTIWAPLGVSASACARPLGDAQRHVRSLRHRVERDAATGFSAAVDVVAWHRAVVESGRRVFRRAVSAFDQYA